MARLNPTQRRLVREINDLLDIFNLNPLKITKDSDQESCDSTVTACAQSAGSQPNHYGLHARR